MADVEIGCQACEDVEPDWRRDVIELVRFRSLMALAVMVVGRAFCLLVGGASTTSTRLSDCRAPNWVELRLCAWIFRGAAIFGALSAIRCFRPVDCSSKFEVLRAGKEAELMSWEAFSVMQG